MAPPSQGPHPRATKQDGDPGGSLTPGDDGGLTNKEQPFSTPSSSSSVTPTTTTSPSFYLWLSATCALIFSVYWRTLAPSIAGGDSGELVAESCHLGTAHPPGYPLFLMLNHAFINALRSSRGSPAWRANLLAAICDVISAAFLFCSIDLLSKVHRAAYYTPDSPEDSVAVKQEGGGGPPLAATTATLLYAFCPLVWQYAVTAEVFALNNALVAALIYLTLAMAMEQDTTRKLATTFLGAFVCGLALCNQHTAVLYEIPLITYVAWCQRRMIWDRPVLMILILGMCFAGGLLPYAYLPLAAIRHPRAGSWGDVTTLKGLIHHIRRGDYGTFKLYSGDAGNQSLAVKLSEYARDLTVRQGLYILPLIALVGLLASLFCRPPSPTGDSPTPHTVSAGGRSSHRRSSRGHTRSGLRSSSSSSSSSPVAPQTLRHLPTLHEDARTVPLALLAAYAFYMLVFHALSNLPLVELFYGVVARFWMQPNLMVFLWAGVGLDWLIHHTRHLTGRRGEPVVLFLAFVACVGLVVLQLRENYSISDQHDATYFHQYARSLLEPLPKGAVVLINYDMQWTSMRYLHICEGIRPDVTILHLSMMTFKWWAKKHSLYKNVVFPGTHYTRELTLDWHQGGFSIKDFLDHNLDRTTGGIFLGGKLSFDDEAYKEHYNTIPVGLLVQFVRKNDVWPVKHWFKKSHAAWRTIQKELPITGLPPYAKYSTETWESTIVRDYFDHLAESAAHLLDETLKLAALQDDRAGQPGNSSDEKVRQGYPVAKYMVEAAWWMEIVLHFDRDVKAHVVKNLGLAYMHVVRLKETPTLDLPRAAPISDAFKAVLPEIDTWYKREEGVDWKVWATTRFMAAWANFLSRKDAIREPDYENVRSIYEQVTKTRTRPPNTPNR